MYWLAAAGDVVAEAVVVEVGVLGVVVEVIAAAAEVVLLR